MSFYIVLLLVNFACFVPLYAMNFREHPNPFEFLLDDGTWQDKFKRLYTKPGFTDPFRLNFDFSFALLVVTATNYSAPWLIWVLAVLLAFGILEIVYMSIMRSVFKRPPAIASDAHLVKAGFSIVQRHTYWIVPALILLLAGIVFVSHRVTTVLFYLMPSQIVLPLLFAALLALACFCHWRIYVYKLFSWRTVYSPMLHLYRNWLANKRFESIYSQGPGYFERHNHFKDVSLKASPNIVIICIESYGSLVFRDKSFHSGIPDLLAGYQTSLADSGYRFASNYSAAPIFTGGSWLSYVSFTYGFMIDDLQLHDQLFSYRNAFGSYESLFHVLKRNGYESFALCPLGGVDTRGVDWAPIDRCFQTDFNIDFQSLDYHGQRFSFLGKRVLYSAPDQYSLNRAYEIAQQSGHKPFSLFFCTLNSHFPWDSPVEAVSDWRSLNSSPARAAAWREDKAGTADRYRSAIRYQLDYIFKFIAHHSDDDVLFILFGDHQPPVIVPESTGQQTPVHVIGRNATLTNVFNQHGFLPVLNLTGREPTAIRHEGFLSLFLKAMNAAYGENAALAVDYRERGVPLFAEQESSVSG